MTGAKIRNLALLTGAIMLAPAIWFAGTAAVPALLRDGAVTRSEAGWLIAAVQLGFVAGTITSALLSLADRWPSRALFFGAASVAGLGTIAQAFIEPAGLGAYALRFVAGAAMAGVYPVAMKLASGWARAGSSEADRPKGVNPARRQHGDLGLLIGIVVGALTIGSAAPHALPGVLGSVDWRHIYLAAGALALVGGALILPFREGPHTAKRPPFNPRAVLLAWRDPRLRLANAGYLGHMWELYAVWAWVGLFLAQQGVGGDAGILTALVVGSGAIGCVGLGLLADRFNRARMAAMAMFVSGACALLIGGTAGWALPLTLVLAAIWGVSVVADSAQFSACTSLCAPPELVGTMLTVQTCAGFLLTVPAIQLMAWAVPALGWAGAFAILGIGPLLGAVAMLRLAPLLPQPSPR
ncbi:MFS transporter [Roseococcus sp. SDR]|uniref:MFS transporter n=1 Tax=Roseococcus sp. SDR TaxID=2835532 RepID=UPI001BCAB4D6|nr:MFS transporter [Roseococcus sp. SDR]MBS7792724.1 MFS transporter [Roseococcus sp. SDR]MBV1848038.1 MFS transporter [Roseococcus sp. SDR]